MGPGAGAGVAAYDLTFSAPKSASVLFALGGRDVANGVVAAHLDGGGRRAGVPRGPWPRGQEAIGPRAPSSRPAGWSLRRSPTRSTATATPTCTATSSWRTSSTGATDAGVHATAGGSTHTGTRPAAVYEAHLRAGLTMRSAWRGPLRQDPGGPPRSPGIPASVLSANSPRGAPTSDVISTRSVPARQRRGGSRGRPPARARCRRAPTLTSRAEWCPPGRRRRPGARAGRPTGTPARRRALRSRRSSR